MQVKLHENFYRKAANGFEGVFEALTKQRGDYDEKMDCDMSDLDDYVRHKRCMCKGLFAYLSHRSRWWIVYGSWCGVV
jgi:hypothetical protein